MKISKSKTRIINFQSFVSDLFFHICLFTFAFLLLTSCETTEPPPSSQKLTLKAEDASCTEAWLNLKLENISLPTEIEIKQNDSTIVTANINSSDTTLFIENLLPNRTYSFKVSSIQQQVSSIKIPVTTMDTTSHNFIWETYEIGNRGTLRDVAIINENNIWAVGEIYVNDSLGQQEPTACGFAQWNGKAWKITRKEAIGPTGVKSNLRPNGIIAFSEKDIWFAHGGVFHWNGNEITPYWINKFPGNTSPILEDGQLISKLWGISSSNLYAVGTNGALVHFDGTDWQLIPSKTTVDLLDVWGSEDGSVVWACGYDLNYSAVIVEIEGGACKTVYESIDRDTSPNLNNISGRTKSIWGKKKDYYRVLTSYGVYKLNKNKNNSYELDFDIGIGDWGGTTRIRGSDSNNIYFCGSKNRVWHFNGYKWKKLLIPESNSNEFISMDIKEGLSAFVGEAYYSGVNFKGLIMITFN